jgi:aryl sulfotransferase
MERPVVRYRSFISDSARWDSIRFRDGDMVISPPQKCGSTWLRMICALLVLQTPDLGRPLDLVSPWVDGLTRPVEEVVAHLEAQQHRRIMKSHIPLDGMPFDERVTYICVGRDPRDAAISWDNHWSNSNKQVILALREEVMGRGDSAKGMPETAGNLPDSPRDRFWRWVEGTTPFADLPVMLHHLSTFWQVRDRQNVVLLHYDDLKSDLEGQMRSLAGRLRIAVDEDAWPGLAQAATFGEMRRRAGELAPSRKIWDDPGRFFHRGTSGQWRDLLDDSDLQRYRRHVSKLADPELSAWLHREPGWGPDAG